MAFVVPMFAAIGGAVGSLATVAGVGATVLGGLGAIQAGNAQAAAYHSQEQASIYGALIANQQAAQVQDEAAYKAGQIEKQARLKADAAAGGALENGLELGGSTTDLINTIQDTGKLDAMTAIYDGSVTATGLRNQSTQNLVQAQGYRAAAANARTAGFVGAATRTLTGVAGIYRKGGGLNVPQLEV